MKKKNLILLLALVLTGSVLAFLFFWKSKVTPKVSQTQLPSRVEKYYQETQTDGEVREVSTASDLDSLIRDLDSTPISIDTELGQLDKDFSAF